MKLLLSVSESEKLAAIINKAMDAAIVDDAPKPMDVLDEILGELGDFINVERETRKW